MSPPSAPCHAPRPPRLAKMSTLTRTLLPALIAVLLAPLAADAYSANGKAPAVMRHDTTTTSRYPFLEPVKERLYKDTRHHHPPPSASVSQQRHHHGRALPPATDLTAGTPSTSLPAPPPPPQSPLGASSAEHRRPYGFGEESDGGRHDRDGEEGDEDAEDDEDDDEDEDEEEGDGDSVRYHPGVQPELRGKSPWASVASTTTTRTPPAVATPTPMSVYSQFKWEKMGRRQTLDEFKNSRVNAYKKPSYSAADAKEAQQHALRASRESVCKVPRPRVVRVSDVHPHHGKTYVPHCTVLHRCGADTGCCHAASHTCVARRSHRVELYFHSSTIMGGGAASSSSPGGRYSQASGYPHTSNAVEKLVFYNHTECACHDTGEDLMPRDMAGAWPAPRLQPQPQPPPPLQGAASPARHHPQHESHLQHQHHQQHHHQQHHHQLYQQQDAPSSRSSGGCRCPAEFSPRHFADAPCACDCFDKQRDCLRLKKGKDYFTHQDKLCMEKKQCQVPSCSYGAYSRLAGRCPRKQAPPPPPPTSSPWGRHPPPPRRHSSA